MLEALLEYERSIDPRTEVVAARRRGEAYLLERGLMRRLSTGGPIVDRKRNGTDWTQFAFPCWWHYDVLRGLDYMRAAGVAPDARTHEARALVASRRDEDGRWRVGVLHEGRPLLATQELVGAPSRWMTLRALRALGVTHEPEAAR